MAIPPEFASHLVRDRHRQILEQASQRHPRRRPHRPATARRANPATRIARRLATAIASAGAVAAQAPGVTRRAGRTSSAGQLPEPAGQATVPPAWPEPQGAATQAVTRGPRRHLRPFQPEPDQGHATG
jgi:hypothetical protein